MNLYLELKLLALQLVNLFWFGFPINTDAKGTVSTEAGTGLSKDLTWRKLRLLDQSQNRGGASMSNTDVPGLQRQ